MSKERLRINGKDYEFVDTTGDGIPDTLKEVRTGFLQKLQNAAIENARKQQQTGDIEQSGHYDKSERDTPPTRWGESDTGPGAGEPRHEMTQEESTVRDMLGLGSADEEVKPLDEVIPNPALRGCMTAMSIIIALAAFAMFIIEQGGIDGEKFKRMVEEYYAPATGKKPAQEPKVTKKAKGKKSLARKTIPVYDVVESTDAPKRRGRAPILYLSFDDDFDSTGTVEIETRVDGKRPTFVSGVHGKAANFGGKTTVWLHETENIKLKNGYTMEMWVSPNVSTKFITGKVQQIIASDMIGFIMRPPGRSDVNFKFFDGGYVSKHLSEYKVTMKPKNWYHVAMVYEKEKKKYALWTNGVKLFERDIKIGGEMTPMANEIGYLYIGNNSNTNMGFDGRVDEFYIYDYPRADKYLERAGTLTIQE